MIDAMLEAVVSKVVAKKGPQNTKLKKPPLPSTTGGGRGGEWGVLGAKAGLARLLGQTKGIFQDLAILPPPPSPLELSL